MENNSPKRLYRSTKEKMISGVCGGIGTYFNIDPTLIRLAFVLLCALAGGGLIAYVIAAIIIPEEPAAEASAARNTSQGAEQTTQTNTDNRGASSVDDTNHTDGSSPTML